MKRFRAEGLLGLVIALAGCAPGSPTPPPVAAPTTQPVLPDDAAPRAVLETFLKSLVIRDCAVTRQLSTEPGFLQAGAFCQRIIVFNFSVGEAETVVGDDEIVFATRLSVDAGSVDLPEGEHTIFFSLGRQPNGAWRVIGGRTGH